MDCYEFESKMGKLLSKKFNKKLVKLSKSEDVLYRKYIRKYKLDKKFDYASEDLQIIGEAKYYKSTISGNIPEAKLSTISEYVWLLEKLECGKKFIIFGNDKKVPREWLKRYGKLIENKRIRFYFYNGEKISYFTKTGKLRGCDG